MRNVIQKSDTPDSIVAYFYFHSLSRATFATLSGPNPVEPSRAGHVRMCALNFRQNDACVLRHGHPNTR
jgi:hypothetical protein